MYLPLKVANEYDYIFFGKIKALSLNCMGAMEYLVCKTAA